jgi:D-alanine-D-alanine ligase
MDIIILTTLSTNTPEDILDIDGKHAGSNRALRARAPSQLLQFDAAGIAQQRPRARKADPFNLSMPLPPGRPAYFVPDCWALGLPYTDAHGSLYLTTDKLLAKQLMGIHGIDTPPWITLESSRFQGGRYLVKPVRDDASIGIDEHSLVDATDAGAVLREIARRTAATGKGHYAEQFIDGREFTVCLYGAATTVAMTPMSGIRRIRGARPSRMFTFARNGIHIYAFDHITDRHASR